MAVRQRATHRRFGSRTFKAITASTLHQAAVVRGLRAARSLPMELLEWGLDDSRVDYVRFWRNRFVACNDRDIPISMWRLPNPVLLGVFNYNGEQAKDAVLRVDLNVLGLAPELGWREFVWASAGELDVPHPTLKLANLQPHAAQLIRVNRY